VEDALTAARQEIESYLSNYAHLVTTNSVIGSLHCTVEHIRDCDTVCILTGITMVVLLRPKGSSFLFVGTVLLNCPLRDIELNEEFFANHETRTFDLI
jgi:hypothetical protein